MTFRVLADAGDLTGKKVFLRADFDVPVVDGTISEPFRIERQKATLHYLLDHGAHVVLAAHISAVPSFEPVKPQLERLLEVTFGDAVTLLENTRAHPGEEKNDEVFARELVAGCDMYVNNAFAVCHRAHASVVAASRIVPSYAGLLIEEEVAYLSRVMGASAVGKLIVMGGAKASTKVPVIKHLIRGSEHIAVGGVVANDILKERGEDVGASRVDDDTHTLLAGLDLHDPRLVIPHDQVRDEQGAIVDIGPIAAERFATLAQAARVVIWNGPLGKFEDVRYLAGTQTLAEAIVAGHALSVIGGGDTIASVTACGIALDRFGFVSTGGGAMLAFLAGERLPGLEALGYENT